MSLTLTLALAFLTSTYSFAATGCSYPVTLDTFTNVSTGQILTAAEYNRLLCLAERLETHLTLPRYTVATLPASPVVGQQAIVTNALDGSTCTTGGGSSENECTYKSGGWVVSSGGGGGGGAPTAATYITRTSDGTLSNEFALSSLTNGILRHTGGTPATAVAGTDYVSPSGSGAGLTNLNASNLASGNVPIARNTISVLDGTASYCLGTSGTDSYSCALPSAPTSYATGGTYRFKADVANTGAASIEFNSLGAKTIKKWVAGNKVDLVTGDISANQVVTFMYDGTDMVAVSFGGGGGGGGSFTYITEDATGPLITGAIRYGSTGTNDLTDDYTNITGHKTRTKKNVDGEEAVTIGTLTANDLSKFDASGRLVRAGPSFKVHQFLIGAENGSALVDADDQPSIFYNHWGQGVTITEVFCEADGGTPTINLQRDDGSPANILSSNLTCSSSGATSTSFSATENQIASTNRVDFVLVSAGGTAKRILVSFRYTMD